MTSPAPCAATEREFPIPDSEVQIPDPKISSSGIWNSESAIH